LGFPKSIVAAMENYKELLTALYKEHAPEKIDQIDFYLERYKGKEKQFYITQKAKYANKKSVTDSKKILKEAMARIKKTNKKTDIETPPPSTSEKPKAETTQKQTTIEKEQVKSNQEETQPKEAKKPEKSIEHKDAVPEKKDVKSTEKSENKEAAKISQTEASAIKNTTDNKKPDVIKDEINPPLKNKEMNTPASASMPIKDSGVKKENTRIENETQLTGKTDPDIKSKDKKSQKDLDDDRARIIQDNWKKEEERIRQKQNEMMQDDEKKSSGIWYFIGISVILLLIALALWVLFFRDVDSKPEKPINVQKVKVEKSPVSNPDKTETKNKEKQENKQKENNKIAQQNKPTEESGSNVKKETTAKKETIAPAKEKPKVTAKPQKKKQTTQTHPTADRIYAKDINKPAIFVGCFATKTENQAQKKIALLKEQGLDAHYYWIPDLNPKGNSYFKVVAGPFSSISDAYPSLTKAQERVNFDSYILTIK